MRRGESYLLTAAIVLGTLVLVDAGVAVGQDVSRVAAAPVRTFHVFTHLLTPAISGGTLVYVCRGG